KNIKTNLTTWLLAVLTKNNLLAFKLDKMVFCKNNAIINCEYRAETGWICRCNYEISNRRRQCFTGSKCRSIWIITRCSIPDKKSLGIGCSLNTIFNSNNIRFQTGCGTSNLDSGKILDIDWVAKIIGIIDLYISNICFDVKCTT